MPNLSQSELDHLSALKPCPFCGGNDQQVGDAVIVKQISNGFWIAECQRCGHASIESDNPELAKTIWNTRPLEEQLSAQLAQAQAERDAARFALCRAYQTMELPDGKHIVDRDWDLIEALIESGIYGAALKDGKE